MARLPNPGEDQGNWGNILNEYLKVALNDDGTVKDAGVVASKYEKPSGGIPEADLAGGVQTKLNASSTDAAADTKGVVRLTGDLGGTAASPTVPGLADKLDADGGVLASNLSAAGNKIVGAADGVADTDYATVGQITGLSQSAQWVEGGAGDDLDWGVPLYNMTISQTWTPSFINPPESAAQMTVRVTMDGTQTIVWPPEIQWEGGSAPAPADGDQIIVELLRGSHTEIYGWIVNQNTPIVQKAPGDVTGLVQHLDAHEDAGSLTLMTQSDYDAANAIIDGIFPGVTLYEGDDGRVKEWVAEVGNNVSIDQAAGATAGNLVWRDESGRRGVLFAPGGSVTGQIVVSNNRMSFAGIGSVLTQHTIIIVIGPVPTNASSAIGVTSGWGGVSSVLLTQDATLTQDDFILSYNYADFAAQIGARWQEQGGAETNRSISDQRDAPAYPDVYAMRYDGTDWGWFRRSGRTQLDVYSQANIDFADRTWDFFRTATGGLPGRGIIHELAIYNTAISDADLISVMDHLTAKWEL